MSGTCSVTPRATYNTKSVHSHSILSTSTLLYPSRAHPPFPSIHVRVVFLNVTLIHHLLRCFRPHLFSPSIQVTENCQFSVFVLTMLACSSVRVCTIIFTLFHTSTSVNDWQDDADSDTDTLLKRCSCTKRSHHWPRADTAAVSASGLVARQYSPAKERYPPP